MNKLFAVWVRMPPGKLVLQVWDEDYVEYYRAEGQHRTQYVAERFAEVADRHRILGVEVLADLYPYDKLAELKPAAKKEAASE